MALYCETAPHATTRPRSAQSRERCLERSATDVVEVHVDAVSQGLAGRDLAIVERLVEADLLEPGHLLGAPGAADHLAALELGDLPGGRADRARGARDEHRLAGLDAPDVQQPDIGREARHPEHAERRRDRSHGGVDAHQAAAVGECELAPAEVVADPTPLRETLVTRGDDLPDRTARHRLAEPERRHVRSARRSSARACTDRRRRTRS